MDSYQAVAVSIQLNRCTIWMLTKHLEKKLKGNYIRMLHAVLKKPNKLSHIQIDICTGS